jgi:DNA-binding NarL/FixJ family response regulator
MQTPTPDAVVDSQPETAPSGSAENDGANVVLVDDHPAVAKGIELLLRSFGHHVVGIADGPESAFRMIVSRRPEVAVVDLGLPRESGAELTRRLLEEDGRLGVLLYTGGNDGALLAEALDCGARGFAFKTGTPDELAEAVSTVAAGGTYMDRRLRAMVLARDTTERVALLSPREREILDGIARGLKGEEIADRLSISPETVRTHVRNAMEKLEAHTRAHAVAIALRAGEIPG